MMVVCWESPENLEKVQHTLSLLLKGCSCKSGCTNRRCSCLKAGRKCGPGCRRINCLNNPCGYSAATVLNSMDIEQAELEVDRVRIQSYNNVVSDSEVSEDEAEGESETDPVEDDISDIESDSNNYSRRSCMETHHHYECANTISLSPQSSTALY